MRWLRLALVVYLAAATAPPAAAQAWQSDTSVRRLDWGTVNVLVSADTAAGVGIWAETSSLLYSGPARAFIASFDPTDVAPWLNRAYAVATLKQAPAPGALALRTPPLVARDSSGLMLIRRRDEYGWDNHVQLLFFGTDSNAVWSIRLPLDRAKAFLQTVFAQALRSRWAPDTSAPREDNPLKHEATADGPGESPPALLYRPALRYPTGWGRQRLDGQVWLRFTVRADGTTDPASFRAPLYDDPAFVDEAVRCLRQSRWRPGTIHGQAVDVVVSQHVIFRTE